MSVTRPFATFWGKVVFILFAAVLVPSVASAKEPFQDNAFAEYQGNVENGKYLTAAAGCAACHASGNDPLLLGGGMKIENTMGNFFAPNITKTKIGSWTNAQFLNAVMRGVSPDGSNYYPVFPYLEYAGMKPEDVLDIKAYINSLEGSDNVPEPHAVSAQYRLRLYMARWKGAYFTTPDYQNAAASPQERGRYLVENVAACGHCHTANDPITWAPDTANPLGGARAVNGAITPDISAARMASVDEKAFTQAFFEQGHKLSGSAIADPLKQRYVAGWKALNEDDRIAILSYLSNKEIKKGPPPGTTKTASCEAVVAAADAPQDASALGVNAGAVDSFMRQYCTSCHGAGERYQGAFPALDLASIASNKAFVTPGNRNASGLYLSVSTRRMPTASPRPSDAEIEALGQWIDSLAASAQPETVGTVAPTPRGRDILAYRDYLSAINLDISAMQPADRPYARYFSYRELQNSMFACENMDAFMGRLNFYKAGFNKMLNSVSNGRRLIVPTPVADTRDMIVRVDLRDLNWTPELWERLVSEYQYGVDPASEPLLQPIALQTHTKIPLVRTDWLIAYAGKPAIYYDLLQLPKTIGEYERSIGIDVNRDIIEGRVLRAAFREGNSGVSEHNRMVERHDMPHGGYYWKSYDMAGSQGLQDLFKLPHGPLEIEAQLPEHLKAFHHDGGEMVFSLPNGMQGYYLSEANGQRLDIGPTSIVSNRNRPRSKGIEIVNARSCFDCHADGILRKADDMRTHIERSPNFTSKQQELLLKMYVTQPEMDRYYNADREKFVNALAQIGAAEQLATGGYRSLPGPGDAEIITWNADMYEDKLDMSRLAGEFDLTPEEFERRIIRTQEPVARSLAIDWITQLKSGEPIARKEVEENYAAFLYALTDLQPYRVVAPHQQAGQAGAQHVSAATPPKAVIPDYKLAPEDQAKVIRLAVKVGEQNVKVGDRLNFSVSTEQTCELQVFYIESDKTVEVIPQVMLGAETLHPGEQRQIPQPNTGNLVFNEPGYNETLLTHCVAPGGARLSKEKAQELALKHRSDFSRGIIAELAEPAPAHAQQPAAAPVIQPGVHTITFNVQ